MKKERSTFAVILIMTGYFIKWAFIVFLGIIYFVWKVLTGLAEE